MSVRDQRVGTSYSDRVREDVSLEYVTAVAPPNRIMVSMRL